MDHNEVGEAPTGLPLEDNGRTPLSGSFLKILGTTNFFRKMVCFSECDNNY